MNDIVKSLNAGGQLSTNFNAASLMKSTAAMPKSSDKPFLVFKDGEWTYGADAAEIDPSSAFAINPNSFMFGLIEWLDSSAGAELYVPAGQDYSADDLVLQFDSSDKNHRIAPQMGCELVCVAGPDEGLEVHYKVSTRGGVDALNKIAVEIAKQTQGDEPEKVVPVVTLSGDSYMHKKYKRRTYTPVITIDYFDDFNLSLTQGESGDQGAADTSADAALPTPEAPASTAPEAETPTGTPPAGGRRRRRS